MTDLKHFTPPADLDWRSWVDRWDRMQERYLVKRAERFDTIIRMIRATQRKVENVVDLGCGTGSLMFALLDALPEARVVGVDFDPIVLWLAKARLARFGERASLVTADLRDPSWTNVVHSPVDAVVSATAIHWLTLEQLTALYGQLAEVIRPGGIFLSADHVGSDSPEIQRAWEDHRQEMRAQEADSRSDDWKGFWAAYMEALGLEARETRERVIGGWEGGVEDGLPLAWHLDRLREHGFAHVDCFWRSDCDAVYGGIRT